MLTWTIFNEFVIGQFHFEIVQLVPIYYVSPRRVFINIHSIVIISQNKRAKCRAQVSPLKRHSKILNIVRLILKPPRRTSPRVPCRSTYILPDDQTETLYTRGRTKMLDARNRKTANFHGESWKVKSRKKNTRRFSRIMDSSINMNFREGVFNYSTREFALFLLFLLFTPSYLCLSSCPSDPRRRSGSTDVLCSGLMKMSQRFAEAVRTDR